MNKPLLLGLGLSLASVMAHADDPANGSAAPGKLSCQITYFLYDPTAPAQLPPACPTCTMRNPQHSMVTPAALKLDGTFIYLYGAAKQSTVSGTDGILTLKGSAQINADGYNNGIIRIYRGQDEVVGVMGPIVGGSTLQIDVPMQGLSYQDKTVEKITASCFVQ